MLGDMDVSADLTAPCAPDELFAWVDDLGRYPQWLAIVTSAAPVAPVDGRRRSGVAGRPAWPPRSARPVQAAADGAHREQ